MVIVGDGDAEALGEADAPAKRERPPVSRMPIRRARQVAGRAS